MKHSLAVAAALVVLALASPSAAQKDAGSAPVLTAADYLGTWNGAIDWRAVEGYDNPHARWELRSDGTFVDDYGDTGSWSVGPDGYISVQYSGGGNARYTGVIMGSMLFGTMVTSDGQYNGAFAMAR
jgi:hypothetical protein